MALQNYIIVKKYYNFFTSFNNLFAFFSFSPLLQIGMEGAGVVVKNLYKREKGQ